mmetsp:Transcript_550/g.713  ORF Transcript_550/g.713 Transcript_550/m.713 type:complete len:219 (+) Transcript_550:44-700(+)
MKYIIGKFIVLACTSNALNPRQDQVTMLKRKAAAIFTSIAAVGAIGPQFAVADGSTTKFTLPPITESPDRCSFVSSAMGQANAARDKLYDLRKCDMRKKSAENFDLAGAIISDADFTGVNFKDAKLSKAYGRNSKFIDANFQGAVVDRVSFDGSDFTGASFENAVLTGTSFETANLENVDFTDAFFGDFDLKRICKNPTLKGENPKTGVPTRESAGCE